MDEDSSMLQGRIRRSRENIIAEIIRATLPGATKTKIMFKAGLNFKQLGGYIDFLCTNEFLFHDVPSRSYRATSKGIAYVEKYDQYAKAKDAAKAGSDALRDLLENPT